MNINSIINIFNYYLIYCYIFKNIEKVKTKDIDCNLLWYNVDMIKGLKKVPKHTKIIHCSIFINQEQKEEKKP